MRIDRDTVRVVVPPLLALAFVAVLVHPVDDAAPALQPVAEVPAGR